MPCLPANSRSGAASDAITFSRSPMARVATLLPIRPNPTIPKVFPRKGIIGRLVHAPDRTCASPCAIDLATANNSASVCSATAS